MFNLIKGCCLLVILFMQNISVAQEIIPDDLVPWQQWVLRDHKEQSCPRPYNQSSTFFCHWPSEVKLAISDSNVVFSQKGVLYQSGWVMLIGDKQNWPSEVTVNNKTIAIIEQHERPFVFLDTGNYHIEGKFNWSVMPERIAIPDTVGLVQITINDNEIKTFDRDRNGYLWLRKMKEKPIVKPEADSIQLRVYRKLKDSIPQETLTLLKVFVTGKEREAIVGPVIDAQQSPIFLKTQLPARLDEDGTLRMQVKPGTWDIYINSRYLTQSDKLHTQTTPSPWPDEEIWSFEPQPQYRQVEITGPLSIDPTQAEVPQPWRQFPAYLMKQDTTFDITEKQRGKIFERGEKLRLQREMWLDFDGKGITLQDQLTGMVEDNWRLSAAPPLAVGRVSINHEDQLITTLPDNQQPGVEIRNGHVDLMAVSRIANHAQSIPAIGWNRDVNHLNSVLHLPPGWKLWNVLGVDKVSNAWLRNWNLLDLFLVLLVSLSVFKLLGLGWGILALITMGLIYQEPISTLYSWLAVLAGLGVLKVMPEGSGKHWVKIYTLISLVFLIVVAVPFIGTQLQTALYPQLNPPDNWAKPYVAKKRSQLMGDMADLDRVAGAMPGQAMESMRAPVQQLKSHAENSERKQLEKKMKDYDPDAKVQTGPGIPNWTWHRIDLSWQGPVTRDQTISLWLIPAWMVSILKFIQVILVISFIFALSRASYTYFKKHSSPSDEYTAASKNIVAILLLPLMLLLFNLGASTDAFADIPEQSMLNDLRAYLLKAPECMPACADYDKAQFIIEAEIMTMRLEVQAAENIALPLPHNERGWLLKDILLNGNSVNAIKQDEQGVLWVYVEKGSHELIMTGRLAPVNSFNLTFNLQPKWLSIVNSANSGWAVNGVTDNKMTGQSMQFNRAAPVAQNDSLQENKTLAPTEIPPFVEFIRTIHLGLEWEILNEVRRISPQHDPIHLNIPLLKNERVLSSNVKVQNREMNIQLAESQQRMQWRSKLAITPQIELKALESTKLKEIWRLQISPMWHATFSGLPVIHQQSKVGQWLPEWHPWPGEQLMVDVIKPQALKGNTLTVDNSHYLMQPGKRKSEHELSLNIRSSQGGQHAINLPSEIKIQDVLIQNLSQPINLEGNQLNFPIYPGTQNITVKWESSTPLQTKTATPAIAIESNSTNHVTQINISNDRWILWLSGPEVGPVVRYWAVLCLTIIIAFALGASGLTPLATWQWLLLGLGVTLTTPFAAFAVIAWFILLQLREKFVRKMDTYFFQISQIVIVILTGIFVVSLLVCITSGLLGNPQMQLSAPSTGLINSNFITATHYQLQWYQDQIQSNLPTIWILTIPLFVYRLLMLVWALWLAFSLLKWFQWGWTCFAKDGIWTKETEKEINTN